MSTENERAQFGSEEKRSSNANTFAVDRRLNGELPGSGGWGAYANFRRAGFEFVTDNSG